jgi:hypothetical protein
MHKLKDRDCQSGSKNMTEIYVVYKKSIFNIGTYGLQVNRWRRIYRSKINQKKVGISVFISDRNDFRARKVIRDKKELYISQFSKKTYNACYICT